ncbi:MAG: prevent-host-death protein [Oribacterium sp.]|nr:prevent-host-death protein [Oribacterium sp.]
MPTITPISDLKNYDRVLDKVSKGSPVYLTGNGRRVYSIRDMDDEKNFEKAEAMIRFLCDLNAGIISAEENGWISDDDLRTHIHNRRK